PLYGPVQVMFQWDGVTVAAYPVIDRKMLKDISVTVPLSAMIDRPKAEIARMDYERRRAYMREDHPAVVAAVERVGQRIRAAEAEARQAAVGGGAGAVAVTVGVPVAQIVRHVQHLKWTRVQVGTTARRHTGVPADTVAQLMHDREPGEVLYKLTHLDPAVSSSAIYVLAKPDELDAVVRKVARERVKRTLRR